MMKSITFTLMALVLGLASSWTSLQAKDELPLSLQKASDVIGTKVESATGENLGKIEDVVLDTSSGRIAYAVLSFGGFLGIGDKLFAIPWQALKENKDRKACVLAVDKETLKNAPGFDKKNWPNLSDTTWRQEVHTFYKIPLYSADPGVHLALSDIRRESTPLPLNLWEGMTVAYNVSCSKEGEEQVQIKVLSVAGDESKVEIQCSRENGPKATPCIFTVAKDGTVRPPAAAPAPKPGEENKPAKDEQEKVQFLVQHVFGQGLHRDKLEPGKEYTMPGSLPGHSSPPATASGTGDGTGRGAAPSAGAGTHRMRFEGVATRNRKTVAVFTLLPDSSGPATTSPPATSPPATARDDGMGKAAYRTADGLLDAMAFEGVSIRRFDGKVALKE